VLSWKTKNKSADSQIVTLESPDKNSALPQTLTVRFVRVMLKTGEYEVLVTSLLDEIRYPTPDFARLYWLCWGIKTFYGLLKSRLALENFTENGVEAVLQDFSQPFIYLA
jgi:hypothetical protein